MFAEPITTLLSFPVLAGILATARPQYERFVEQYERTQSVGRINTEYSLILRMPAATEITLVPTPVVQDKRDLLLKVIARFAALPNGWDGEGSSKPSSVSVEAAKAFLASIPAGIALPIPMVTSVGEMEFYWKLPVGYCDISFDADGVGSLFAKEEAGDEFFLDNLGSDFRQFSDQQRIFSILAPHLLSMGG